MKRHPILAFYLLAFVFSWTLWVLDFTALGKMLIVSWIGDAGPAFAAILVTAITIGRPGVETLLASLFRWRVKVRWYLIALFLPAFHVGVTILGYTLFSGDPNPPHFDPNFWLDTFPTHFPVLLLSLPLGMVVLAGEEIGWRGYALPQVEKRYGSLAACLITGALWGAWHIIQAADPQSTFQKYGANLPFMLFLFILATTGYTFLYAWIARHSNGSLLLACLFHAAYDITSMYAGAAYPFIFKQPVYYLVGLGLIVAVILALGGLNTNTTALAPVVTVQPSDEQAK